MNESAATETFQRWFGAPPEWVARAPGRVNLIGEHTDYNGGFVLPAAIDLATWIALRRRHDRIVTVRSIQLGEAASFDLGSITRGDGWQEYIKGVAWALTGKYGALSGWEGVVSSDLPIGAGLSSSAALELAAARAFAAASSLNWNPDEAAALARRAEQEWVGVNCGIMDQLIVAVGEKDHAMLLDCRSLDRKMVRMPNNLAVVVLDTGTRRDLASTAYNSRREECATAARLLGVRSLRDASEADLANLTASDGTGILVRRARHVIRENARTLRAADALGGNDAAELGRLLNESHASLRDDFKVSTRALDRIVELALAHSSCYGARLTGAGFGGCALAIVDVSEAESFASGVCSAYNRDSAVPGRAYVCRVAAGVAVTGA